VTGFPRLLDLFVDLPDDGLVFGKPFLPEAHRPVLLQWLQPSDTRGRHTKPANCWKELSPG
jgi:hypothetical protein